MAQQHHIRKGRSPLVQQDTVAMALQRLDTSSLAALSCTCKTWHVLVQPHLRSMALDLSLGQEPVPIGIDAAGPLNLPRQFWYQAVSPTSLPVVWDAGCSCQATATISHHHHACDGSPELRGAQCTAHACPCSVPPAIHQSRQQQTAIPSATVEPHSCATPVATTQPNTCTMTPNDGVNAQYGIRKQPDDQQPCQLQETVTCASNSSHPPPPTSTAIAQTAMNSGYIWECGPACSCGIACQQRTTQTGITVNLTLRHTTMKGWGVLAAQDIPYNTFVCLYVGEHISSNRATQRLSDYDAIARQQSVQECTATSSSDTQHTTMRLAHMEGHALLVVREHLPGGTLRSNIDATYISNIARFINHSCDGGNLTPVVVHRSGCLLPEVALFANRDIHAQEELTFAYGPPCCKPTEGYARHCCCGTVACLGYLPSTSV